VPELEQAGVPGCLENDLVEIEVEMGDMDQGGCPAGGSDVFLEEGGVLPQRGCGESLCDPLQCEARDVKLLEMTGGKLLHESAPRVAELHQTVPFQCEQGFSNGNPAYAELSGDRGFGEQGSGSALTGDDAEPQLGGGVFEAGAGGARAFQKIYCSISEKTVC